MQFLIFALNNKFTTYTCKCSLNRLYVQESLRAFVNENPKSASFLAGIYKIHKVTQLLLQKKSRYSYPHKSSSIESGHNTFEKVKNLRT